MIQRTITRFLAAAVVLALAVPAAAQTGLVKGKVVGPDGKPVADAAITIESVDGSSRKLATKSDKRGEFVQLGLQSGGYRVTATAAKLGSGFADVRVRIGNSSEVTITLSPVPPGTEGAVSLEGTAASLVGGMVMAGLCRALGLLADGRAWLLVSAVALVATLVESLIGATLQRRWRWLSNELVNGLQTLLAALLAIAMAA